MLCKIAKTFAQPAVSTSVEGGHLADNALSKLQSRFASPRGATWNGTCIASAPSCNTKRPHKPPSREAGAQPQAAPPSPPARRPLPQAPPAPFIPQAQSRNATQNTYEVRRAECLDPSLVREQIMAVWDDTG